MVAAIFAPYAVRRLAGVGHWGVSVRDESGEERRVLGRLVNVLTVFAGIWCALIFLLSTRFQELDSFGKWLVFFVAFTPIVVVLIVHYVFRGQS
jgi:hypothetical protein